MNLMTGGPDRTRGLYDPEDVFSIDIYTGDSAARSITNSIDLLNDGGLVWVKSRTSPYSHMLFDTERGTGKKLNSDSTGVEQNITTSLTAFNSDGFSLGVYTYVNQSGQDFVSWTLKQASKFFDVVTYTGTSSPRTIAHSLGTVPELVIVKGRTGSNMFWPVYLKNPANLGVTNMLQLDKSDAKLGTGTEWWTADGVTKKAPDENNIYIGTATQLNATGEDYVAYLFGSLPRVSKVGSYTGNGTSQSINCSFAGGARFVMIKRTDDTGDWFMWDTERGIVTGNDPHVSANTTAVEATTDDSIDPVAHGFQVNQVAATNINVNNAEYIFYAVA